MAIKSQKPTAVDGYIAQFPSGVQQIMQNLRAVIKEAAPQVEEKISYGMAGYYLNGGLIWFGGFKNHVGIYPLTAGMKALKGVSVYPGTKGSIHFSLDEPMPYDLIREIVKIRVAENERKV